VFASNEVGTVLEEGIANVKAIIPANGAELADRDQPQRLT
jgi:hypothetical protein